MAITNPDSLISDEMRRRIEALATQQNREPADVLAEAVRRYASACSLDRLSNRLEKSALDRGIREEDVPMLVEQVRRENEARGR